MVMNVYKLEVVKESSHNLAARSSPYALTIVDPAVGDTSTSWDVCIVQDCLRVLYHK